MVSSGVFAGAFTHEWANANKDRDGVTFGAALDAIGYRGDQRCGDHPLSAFFELHIEQGPILEAEDKEIGIVTGVQGMRWYEVTVAGQDSHTGATPMRLRKNALLGAARLVERINAIAERHKPDALGAVGLMEVRPNSRNVVPGEVFFCVDFRHPDNTVLDQLEAEYNRSLAEVCDPLGLTASSTRIWDQPPVRFDADCVASVRRAAALSGLSAREIVSGAGHDAAYVSRVAPTAMIFVPCRDGVSHNEAEYSSKEQCAAGAQVLLQAVLDYDRTLAERSAEQR
jgi:N-carbamoyl-L-amino-acid hydrolase